MSLPTGLVGGEYGHVSWHNTIHGTMNAGVRSYADLRDYGLALGATSGDITTYLTAAATGLGASGGFIYIPKGNFTLPTDPNLPANVCLIANEWSESATSGTTLIPSGSARATGLTLNTSSALVFVQVGDTNTVCTTQVVLVSGSAVDIIDSRVATTGTNVTALQINGDRCNLTGGRFSSSAGTVIGTSGISDLLMGTRCRVVGLLPWSSTGTGGGNLIEGCHFNALVATNCMSVNSSGITFTGCEFDSVINGALVLVTTTGGQNIKRVRFNSCYGIAANITDNTYPVFKLDASSGGSIQGVFISDFHGHAGNANRYKWFIQLSATGTIGGVSVSDSMCFNCLDFWDTAGQAISSFHNVYLPDVSAGSTFRGEVGIFYERRKSATQTINSQTTPQDVTGMNFPIMPGETMTFEAFVIYDSPVPATAGCKLDVTVPAAATIAWAANALDSSVTTAVGSINASVITASGTTLALGCAGAGTSLRALLTGTVVNSTTGGTVQLQFSQVVSNAGNTRIVANSWIKARKVAA